MVADDWPRSILDTSQAGEKREACQFKTPVIIHISHLFGQSQLLMSFPPDFHRE